MRAPAGPAWLAYLALGCCALGAVGGAQGAEETLTFSSDELNLRLSAPAGWQKMSVSQAGIRFGLQHGTDVIMLSGGECNDTLEGVYEDIRAEWAMRNKLVGEVEKSEVQVAGARGLEIQGRYTEQGIGVQMKLTLFTHQGIVYRLIGVHALGEQTGFDRDYAATVRSVSFLKERKEWMEKFEGRPQRTAMLGGLLAFELNRPRWKEWVAEKPERDAAFVERVEYRFLSGGAWIQVRVRRATGDAASELEHFRQTILEPLKEVQIVATEFPDGRVRRIPGLRAAWKSGVLQREIRTVVFVQGPWAAQVWIETLRSNTEATRPDRERLLGTFQLRAQEDASEPLAYMAERGRSDDERAADPAFQALSQKALRLPLDRNAEVLGISPDGARVLFREDHVPYLVEVETNRRQPLRLAPPPAAASRISWSPDGKKVLYTSGENLVVAALEPLACKTYKVKVEEAVFGPAETELWAVVKGFRATPQGLYFHNYRLPEEQWGLYKIDRQELERRTAALPMPLQIRARALAHDLSEGVRGALNGKDLAKHKPSEELLAKAAQACQAIAGGNEVPAILLLAGDSLMKQEPRRALALYRKAVQNPWPGAEACLKLGRAYAALGKLELAEACWRHGLVNSYGTETKNLARLLKGEPEVPPEAEAQEEE